MPEPIAEPNEGQPSETPFLIGADPSSGPLHAVKFRFARGPRREVPTVCGTRAVVARDWGGFARGNPRIDTRDLCPLCRWHVAIATSTTAAELAVLTPSDAEQVAMGRVMQDPLIFVRTVEQILEKGRENDTDIEAWSQILGHVTAHRPVLLLAEECCEDACDHDTVQDCYGEKPTVACEACSFRAGWWAGEREGWFSIPVAAPCCALTAVAAHHKVLAVAP